jgi:hypothetical protein
MSFTASASRSAAPTACSSTSRGREPRSYPSPAIGLRQRFYLCVEIAKVVIRHIDNRLIHERVDVNVLWRH